MVHIHLGLLRSSFISSTHDTVGSLEQQKPTKMMPIARALSLASLFTFHYLTAAQNSTLDSSLSSECAAFITKYPPTVSLYASQICHVCQGLQLSPSVEPCCSNSNPTACFASSFYSISITGATTSAPITVAPPSYTGSANCDAVISILQSCENASPGFDNLCFHDQQSCLCSTSGTWAPSYYDDYWSSCLSWASASDASSYSLLGPHTNGVVESRKCQTWEQLTATGGTPSNCLTSPSNVLSSTSLATVRPTTLVAATATGAAAGLGDMQVSVSLCKLLSRAKITKLNRRLVLVPLSSSTSSTCTSLCNA